MVEHLLPTTSAFLEADVAACIAHIRAPRWIGHPVAFAAHDAMRQLLERPPSLRPRGLLLAGPYHNGKTMIAERFAVEHLRRADRQRVWVIQTREGAGLSHFYASILSGLRAPQVAGWRSLSRASEQVDHLLDSLKPRLLIFDEFHSALRGRRQDVKAIFSFLRRIARVHDISPVLVGEIAVYDALHDTDEMGSRFDTVTVSPARRYRVAAGRRWPMEVRPRPGELLSSWLHRLAHANGVPPRYFGAVLGAAGETWSAQLDRHVLDAVRRLLLDHTSICPEEIDGLCLANSPLSTLRLRLRTRPQDAGTSTAQSCWLQFCPTCLRDDEVPYFRRSWTLATRVSCFRHGCRLRDRCPSCGQGLAPFRRDRLVPQQYCVFCDASLAKTTDPANPGARRLERLIDDLLRLDTAGRAPGERKTLPERLATYPVPVGTTTSTIPHLSHRVRHDFFRRLSEGQSGIKSHKGGGPLHLWVRLAKAAGNHNGLDVKALTDQLAETAGQRRASFPRATDLADLLRAAAQLHEGRRSPAEAPPAP